ncbi:peptide-methionine (S)-S-oxide reductase MsrA [Candidatus Pacearchaeota archaeon]|nr:peptide-methionine (S)-S-oxide reductase MsrA [Candidatus Pacearchaeota archaeon]
MLKNNKVNKTETATFGGGCFWGVEYEFSKLPGVISAMSGYMGGSDEYKNPTYQQVCTDKTGYAEVVQIIFAPLEISYSDLLKYFWKIHDPTTLNRQGPDVGTQYRSVIFYHNEKQQTLALKSKQGMQKNFSRKIVTEIVKAKKFYPAEEYHQRYYEKHGIKVNLCRF